MLSHTIRMAEISLEDQGYMCHFSVVTILRHMIVTSSSFVYPYINVT